MDNEGFMMAIDRLEKCTDEIKTDVKDIKKDVGDMKVTLGCTTQKVGIHDVEITEIKKQLNTPRLESSEIKYQGYFWWAKQFFKMNNKHKLGTVATILLFLLGLSLIIAFLVWAVPGFFDFVLKVK